MSQFFLQALQAGDRASVNQAIRDTIESGTSVASTSQAMVRAAERNGEIDLALAVLDALETQQGNSMSSRLERAGVLSRAGRGADALAVIDTLAASEPHPFLHAYLVGTMAANAGQFDRARTALETALDLQPLSGQAWFALSTLGPLSAEQASRLSSLEADIAAADPVERGAYFHSMARAKQRADDHRGAFEAFSASAAAMREVRSFDPVARASAVAAQTSGWDAEQIARFQSEIGTEGPSPIFVTGLPRSGTTLTEQILVSHSAVAGGGEVELFPILLREARSAAPRSLNAYAERHGSLAPLRDLYQNLLGQRFPDAKGRLVDKSVLASPHLGLVASLFPESPIVWVRRDPLDNAWSVFSGFFLRGLNWSWSMADIAGVIASEDRQLDLWQGILGDRLHILDYAALVDQPETTIRGLDSYCRLPFEPEQLHPERTERSVTTASLAQVREPINRKGIGASAPYAQWMGEFVERYRAT